MTKVYVASSWRNKFQPGVVEVLRSYDLEVYDFRNPTAEDYGFSWQEIDHDWLNWSWQQYEEALSHPTAERGFNFDMEALRWCDACVLVLPCGRSAHLELGWAAGACKKTALYNPPGVNLEPELMTKMVDLRTDSLEEVRRWLGCTSVQKS